MNVHTATPYKLGRTYENDGAPETIISADDEHESAVAVALDFGAHSPTTRLKNAEFIVRACNAHDDLVKALQDIADDCADASPPSYGAIRQAAKQALAKAGAA